MGDSATGGYISPSGMVAYDQTLETVFHAFITGLTSLSGTLVRARWQREPPPMPAVGINWCAFAIQSIKTDAGPYFIQHDDSLTVVRHETFELSLTFYGDQGQSIANIFKDSLAIPQNIDQLKNYKIKYASCSEITTAADLLNNQYVHRYDLVATFRRSTERSFAVKTFKSFQIILKT